jgi:hypothetical protein
MNLSGSVQKPHLFANPNLARVEMAGKFGHQNASLAFEQIEYGAASFFVEHGSGCCGQSFRAVAGAMCFLFRISFYIVLFRLSTCKNGWPTVGDSHFLSGAAYRSRDKTFSPNDVHLTYAIWCLLSFRFSCSTPRDRRWFVNAESSGDPQSSKEEATEFDAMTQLKTLEDEVSAWANVSVHPHRFGGREFLFGCAEVGHVHTGGVVDIPFPRSIRDALLNQGLAEEHRWVPNSGWVTFRVRSEGDLQHALWLMRLSYLRYVLKTIGDPVGLLEQETERLHLSPQFSLLLEAFLPKTADQCATEPRSA